MFRMTWGIRRIVFMIGAMLLVGGWGVTGYVDAYQYAAGAAAGERWREGEQESQAIIRQSVPAGIEPVTDSTAGSEQRPQRVSSRPKTTAGAQILRQVTPPSSWLYVLGVLTMMGGAGLMALTVPWRGARMTAAAEAVGQHRYVSPPPPPPPPHHTSIAETQPAAVFPGLPSMQAAQSMAAAAPMQSFAKEPAGKAGVKPLKYKKGA